MSNGEQQPGIPIGATLREARTRLGLDVQQAEDQTKIRTRYIRALENEDWEILPGAVYVRGFLRTYGSVLGLDGDLLADEFRRHHEVADEPGPTPAAENVLSGRKRPGERPPSRGPMIAALLVGLAVVLVLIAVLGGGGSDDDGGGGDGDGNRPAREGNARGGGGNGRSGSEDVGGKGGGSGNDKSGKRGSGSGEELRKEKVSITARTSGGVVCLVGGGDEALIDSQPLAAGDKESFDGYKRYRLDITAGIIRFKVGKRAEVIETSEPVSYEGDSRGVREVNYKGDDCP